MKPFTTISAIIFLVVAAVHLLRLLNGWTVTIDGFAVPMWFGIGGAVVPGLLAVMLYREARG